MCVCARNRYIDWGSAVGLLVERTPAGHHALQTGVHFIHPRTHTRTHGATFGPPRKVGGVGVASFVCQFCLSDLSGCPVDNWTFANFRGGN